MLPTVLLVIPTHNEQDHICECLQSVQNLDYPPELLKVVVVDNGSTDQTLNLVADMSVEFIEAPFVYVGAVRNRGVAHLGSELVGFIDGDCTVEPGWLKRAIDTMRSHKADVVGGAGLLPDSPSWVESAWVITDESLGSPVPARMLTGCGSILSTRKAFEDVGGFNEAITAGEDTLLFEAFEAHGFKVIFDPKISAVHLGYPSTLSGFTRRQVWHASDYLHSNKGLFRDLLYLGTWLSIILFVLILSSLPFSLVVALQLSGVWVALPLVLSLKRIKRANWPKLSARQFVQIYVLDACYLVGRSVGLLKSIFKLLRPPVDQRAPAVRQ
jgi:glycosyltransferase involved in cell wall biosynthesis